MKRKLSIPGIALAALALAALGGAELAQAASPISLLVPQSTAFAVLGASCGGIQEQVQATGFDPATGFPQGAVYLQTRCGGSGRGGGYHVTTYSRWLGVEWDYTGAVLSYAVLAGPPANLDPALSVGDALGNLLQNVLSAVNVQPSACAVGNTTYCTYRAYLTWAPGFVPPPRVAAVSATAGPAAGGTTVAISGTGFTGATAVSFGGAPAASFTVVSDGSIAAVSPASTSGTVDVSVTTPGGTSAASPADEFTFYAAPAVTGLVPDHGPFVGGTSVTITGAGFTTATAVQFGETSIGFTVEDDSAITVIAPGNEAPDSVSVTVTTVGGTSAVGSQSRFTYDAIPAPVVAGVSPSDGSVDGGVEVTISGTGFATAYEVDFGGMPAAFTVNDDTSITAVAPAAAATGAVDVAVTTPGGTSAATPADQFTYTASTGCVGVCAPSIQCARLVGAPGGTMKLGRCAPLSPTNRRATWDGATGTITWLPSGETTVVSVTGASPGQGACPTGRVELDLSGTVVGGTSTYAAVGDAVSAQGCVNASGKLSLIRGTQLGL